MFAQVVILLLDTPIPAYWYMWMYGVKYSGIVCICSIQCSSVLLIQLATLALYTVQVTQG